MPLYEYQCENCGEVFELIQKFSDEPLKVHEKCGGGPVVRLVSAPAFNFKGSGWYVNDYAKGSAAGPANNGGKKEGGSTATAEGGKKDSASSSDSSSSTKSSDTSSGASTPAAPTSGSSSDKK